MIVKVKNALSHSGSTHIDMEDRMKKLLVSVATVGITVIPAASASAMSYSPSTDISASQNQAASIDANKSNSNRSSNTSYYNQTVNYEALSYVKYSASTTAFTTSSQESRNNASLMADFMKNSQSQFSMPSYLSQYSN